MISCQQLNQMSSDYLDGNLTQREKWSIRFHCLMCKYCRRFLTQLRLSGALLSRTQNETVSAEQIETQLENILRDTDPSSDH